MFIAEVWEPPNIAQTHRVAKTREEEITRIVPVPSLLSLLPSVLHQAALCLLPHLETIGTFTIMMHCTALPEIASNKPVKADL